MKLTLLSLLVSGVWGIYKATENTISPLDDSELIENTIQQLRLAHNAPDACTACKSRLSIGKVLSMTRPDVTLYVFQRWCTESMSEASLCEMNFSPSSSEKSSLGSDFIAMLQSMQPDGLDGDYFCYFHDQKCTERPSTPEVHLDTMFPSRPKEYKAPTQSGNSFHVLHIGNINLQLDYSVAAEANCSQSLCCSTHCNNFQSPPKGYSMHVRESATGSASFFNSTYSRGRFERGNFIDIYNKNTWCPAHGFGTYGCDSPPVLLNNTLRSISNFHENLLDFEFAVLTGSVVDHRGRQFLSKAGFTEAQETAYGYIDAHLHSMAVYPSFGDTFPRNQFAPIGHRLCSNLQWQFDFQADLMTKMDWTTSKEANNIRYNHYGYSVVTDRGLKVISLNSNIWSTNNLYNFIGTDAPAHFEAWKFLVKELLDCERNEQRAWIIAETSPNVHSMPIASQVFLSIVQRFSPKVVAAVLFGNDDEMFQVIHDTDVCDENSQAVAFALMAPSVTPFGGRNPGWSYYSVDEDTFDIVNAFTFYTPLNETYLNAGAEPGWKFGYSARDLFDPDSCWPAEQALTPEFWKSVSLRLRNDTGLAATFDQARQRWSPYSTKDVEIFSDDIVCTTTMFTADQRATCMEINDQSTYLEPTVPADIGRCVEPYLPLRVLNQTLRSLESRSLKKNGKKLVDIF